MIELKKDQIIQTRSGTNYILKDVLQKYGGVIAVNEENYECFIYFNAFKVVLDADAKEGDIDELCRAN